MKGVKLTSEDLGKFTWELSKLTRERLEAREYDPAHPESLFELAPDTRRVPEEWRQLDWSFDGGGWNPVAELCSACGWTTSDQSGSYLPRVRITHSDGNAGIWSLGSKWLVKDQPNDDSIGNDYMTWKFLQNQPGHNIPLVKEMNRITDPEDPIQFTLISRAPGKPLVSIWPTLSQEQQAGYRDQLVEILKQLQKFTAPFPQKVNGDKIDDIALMCRSRRQPTCFKIGFTEQEWLEDISETLRAGIHVLNKDTGDEEFIEKKLQEMKDNFPSGAPYTLTHGDFDLNNIFVKDDKIQAIIDWKVAGYYPWWVERYLSRITGEAYMDELFEGVWERVQPNISDDAFKSIIYKLSPIRQALSNARVWHDDQRNGFWRPPFCKCQPFGAIIRPHFHGTPRTHTLADWRTKPGPKNFNLASDEREPEVQRKRDQNTPTPKPSAASARWFETAK